MPHRKICERFNDPGHTHCLTFSCFRRQRFLAKDRSRGWCVDAVDKARDKHGFHLWAYVVMPEHVHLIVCPITATYDIRDILTSIKRSVVLRALAFVARKAPAFLGRMEDRQPSGETHYRFWQRGGGDDRNVIEAATLHRLIDYIHANPVRRGLCKRPGEWLWSSAADYIRLRAGPLRIDRGLLPGIVCADEGRRLPRPRTGKNVPIWPQTKVVG
jgi:putative transposase